MLLDKARTPFGIASRLPWRRLRDHIDAAPGGDGEKAEAQESTELLHARVVLPATPPLGGADSEPDLIAGRCAINGLKHEFEREALLHLTDHDEFRRAIGKGDEIAAAHLALDLQAQPLQMALYRWVEVGFQGRRPLIRTLINLARSR
jgi:hypothetical protein